MAIRLTVLFRVMFASVFLASSGEMFAQAGTIKGSISDSHTKEALGSVGIYLDGQTAATANPDGRYELTVPAGNHSVEFKLIGYRTAIHKIEIKEGGALVLDVALSMEAVELGLTVISAGKFEQKLEEVTVSMDVIKSSFIQNKNTLSADNIMEQCPGVNILDGQANIRGGSGFSYGAGTRVLVLVDDLPLLTADAGDVKWNFIPVENIEQVEIIKGSSSALFGSSALNGVMNFRTRYPKDTVETNLRVSSGIYDNPKRNELVWWNNAPPAYHTASFLHSRQIKNMDLVIGGNGFSDEGYRQLEREQRYRFNFNTRYRFLKAKGLSAGINGNVMDTRGGFFILWQSADSAYYPQGGKVSDYRTIRATFDPYIIYYNAKGNKHSLRTRYYKAINKNNTNQESVSDVWYGEYQYQLRMKKNLTITSGVTGTYSEVISDSLYGSHFSANAGIFSQLDKKFDRLILSLGARGEYFKVDTAQTKSNIILGKDTATIPVHPVFRAGMNYRLLSHTHFRASFGQGYRFPSVAEKFISTKVEALPVFSNVNLQPETGWSNEAGIKQAFKFSSWKGYADVAAFWQEYKNMMEFTFGYWVPDSIKNPTLWDMLSNFGAKSINAGRSRITGTEITLIAEGKIRKASITILAGYTYLKPIALDYDSTLSGGTYNGNILKYRYEHTAKADVQADYKKWSAGISVRYNSFMKNIDKSFQQEIFNDILPFYHSNVYILPGLKEYREKHNKGDVIADVRLSYELSKGVNASVAVNNVFNREYMGRPGDVQPPRTFAYLLSVKL